ncbi:MAG: hypothetical protein ABIH53_02170 [archaeon]
MTKNLETILTKREFNNVKKFLEKEVLPEKSSEIYFDFYVKDLIENLEKANREEDLLGVYALLLPYIKDGTKPIRSSILKLRKYFSSEKGVREVSLINLLDLSMIQQGLIPYHPGVKRHKF